MADRSERSTADDQAYWDKLEATRY